MENLISDDLDPISADESDNESDSECGNKFGNESYNEPIVTSLMINLLKIQTVF